MTGRAPVVAGLAVALAVVLLAVGGAASASAAPGGEPTFATSHVDAPELAPSQDNESDAPEHVHPDDAGEGDEDAVAAWLERELGGSLADGALELERGEYELARQYVGESFRERLDQYVDVAGDGEDASGGDDGSDDGGSGGETGDGDGGTADRFDHAAERQADLAAQLSTHDETVRTYEAARERGDEERARELARRLQSHAENATGTADALQRQLGRLDERSAVDLGGAGEAVNRTAERVRERTDTVVAESFVATSLTVDVDRERIAFDDPATVTGRLVDADDDPVPNATIAVRDPAGATTVETGADGRFSVSHRPVLLPANASRLAVAYRPDPSSVYAAATASTPVDVEPVDGRIAAQASPETAAFGDDVEVTVRTTAGGESVPGIPIEARLGGTGGGATTGPDGRASTTVTVDATVPAGEQSIAVRPPSDERAVALESTEVPVTIESTATALDVEATRVDGAEASVELSGRLTTADGRPVAGESVTLELDGETVASVRTDADGRYATTASPEDGAGSDPGTVEARYAGADSNLEAATASASIPPEGSGSGADGGQSTGDESSGEGSASAGPLGAVSELPAWLAIVLVAVLLALVAAGAWRIRRLRGEPPAGPTGTASPDDGEPTDPGDPLAPARSAVDADPDLATVLAYGAGRSALAAEHGVDGDATHREFRAACASNGLDGDAVGDLWTLTEHYEAAAFGPGGVDAATAREAVEVAERLS